MQRGSPSPIWTAEVCLLGKDQLHERGAFLCAVKNRCKLGNGSKEIAEIYCKYV